MRKGDKTPTKGTALITPHLHRQTSNSVTSFTPNTRQANHSYRTISHTSKLPSLKSSSGGEIAANPEIIPDLLRLALNDVLTYDKWGQFGKLLGRAGAAASQADPEGRVPVWAAAPTTQMKQSLAKLGIKPRQIAVLSAFLGPDQAATEAKVAADPEFASWVKKYIDSRETISQRNYEVELIAAFTK